MRHTGRLCLLLCVPVGFAGLASCSKKQKVEPLRTAEEVKALAGDTGFGEEIVQLVEQESGRRAEQLIGMTDDGEEVAVNGLAVSVAEDEARELVRRLRERLVPQGYKVFLREMNFGFEPDKVGIVKVEDQYDILRMMGTNGWNYNISPEDLIAKLQEWERQCPLEIVGADFDWVEAEMKELPADMGAFAKEVHEFCPDAVDQGTGTVAALVEQMHKTRTLSLWWD